PPCRPAVDGGSPTTRAGGGNPVDGVSRGGGLSPPAEAPHREASGTRLGSDDRGRANRARPRRRPGLNAGPGRLRPTPQEGDDEPERFRPDGPAPAPRRHPPVPGAGPPVS